MYAYIIFLFLLVKLIIWIVSNINQKVFELKIFKRKIRNINSLFVNGFIDTQVLFATKFKALANTGLIKQIDTSKAYELVIKNFSKEITAVYQYDTFDYDEGGQLFIIAVFVLRNERIVVLGSNYAEILYTGKNQKWANALLGDLANFRVINKTKVIGFVNSDAMN